MITIRTTLPPHRNPAEELAKFMPDYPPDGSVPYLISSDCHTWVFDVQNNWWSSSTEEDPQLVTVTYRNEHILPGKELAFVNWVVASRLGWKIVEQPTEQLKS